jgi:hypothetical protein
MEAAVFDGLNELEATTLIAVQGQYALPGIKLGGNRLFLVRGDGIARLAARLKVP